MAEVGRCARKNDTQMKLVGEFDFLCAGETVDSEFLEQVGWLHGMVGPET